MREVEPEPAVLTRPAGCEPPAVVEALVPLAADRDAVGILVTGRPVLRERTFYPLGEEVLVEPGPEGGAEALEGGRRGAAHPPFPRIRYRTLT